MLREGKIGMDSNRKTARNTGVLFIIATIAALAAATLEPALTGADYLTGVANHPTQKKPHQSRRTVGN